MSGYPPQQGGQNYGQGQQNQYPQGYNQQGYNHPQGQYPQQPGQQPYGQQGYYPPQKQGIPGIVIAGFILSFLCSLIGLILCVIGLQEAKRRNAGVGLAIAGICISIFFMLINVVYFIAASGSM